MCVSSHRLRSSVAGGGQSAGLSAGLSHGREPVAVRWACPASHGAVRWLQGHARGVPRRPGMCLLEGPGWPSPPGSPARDAQRVAGVAVHAHLWGARECMGLHGWHWWGGSLRPRVVQPQRSPGAQAGLAQRRHHAPRLQPAPPPPAAATGAGGGGRHCARLPTACAAVWQGEGSQLGFQLGFHTGGSPWQCAGRAPPAMAL